MNLYTALRSSIYLLVATGAFSIWVVEGNPFYLLGVILGGTAAALSVDAGRCRPVRGSLAGILSMILLASTLVPAIAAIQAGENHKAVEEMTHFLCLVQIVLFFTAFKGSVVTFCAANLFIVVVSGILSASPDLILRLLVYLMAATWALLLAALWRERARYEGAGGASAERRPGAAARSTELSERTIRQGLLLTAMLSVGCVIFGFLLFFAWPRVNLMGSMVDWVRYTDRRGGPSTGDGAGIKIGGGGSFPGDLRNTGLNEDGVQLDQFGALAEDPSPSVAAVFTPFPSAWVPGGNRIYLRGLAYERYDGNRWTLHDLGKDIERRTAGGNAIAFPRKDTSFASGAFLEPAGHEKQIRVRVRHISQRGTVYLTAGTPREIVPAPAFAGAVIVDETGGLHTLQRGELLNDGPIYRYEILCNYPVDLERLPATARVAYLNPRHLDWRRVLGKFERPLESLAAKLVRGAANDKEKALRIRAYLLDPVQFRYSLQIPGGGVGPFLFEGRAGPCGYFASAYVMLCRAAGLPARLAVGFAHSETATELASGEVVFRNSDAHAWAEVYFDTFGWVAVDPTPEAREETAPDKHVAEHSKKDGTGGAPKKDEPQFRNDGVVDGAWKYFTSYSQNDQDRMYGKVSEKLEAAVNRAQAWFSGSGQWGMGGAVLLWGLLAAAAGASMIAFLRQQERRKPPLANLPPRARAAVYFYNDLLLVLGKRGFVRRAGQTPREFAEAVVRRGGGSLAPVMLVTEIFERVRYGEQEIGPEELESVRKAFDVLQEHAANLPPGATPAPA